jgi:hypothetical protein
VFVNQQKLNAILPCDGREDYQAEVHKLCR